MDGATYTRDLSGRLWVFVRVGPLPEARGVSVFRAYWDGDRYLVDARGMDADAIALLLRGLVVTYLVTGTEIGRGRGGEPLLADWKASRIPEARASFGLILRDADPDLSGA